MLKARTGFKVLGLIYAKTRMSLEFVEYWDTVDIEIAYETRPGWLLSE